MPTTTAPRVAAHRATSIVMLLALLLAVSGAMAQSPPPAERELIRATTEFLRGGSDDDAPRFIEQRVSPAYRDSMGAEKLAQHLRQIRDRLRGKFDEIAVEASPTGVQLQFGAADVTPLDIRFSGDPLLIDHIDFAALQPDASTPATPDAAVRAHIRAIEALAGKDPGQALQEFSEARLAPGFRESAEFDRFAAKLPELQRVIAMAGVIQVDNQGGRTRVSFRGAGAIDVLFGLQAGPPYRIDSIEVVEPPQEAADENKVELSWESLESQFQRETAAGFSGYVLARRDGKALVDRGFAPDGYPIPQRDTVFDIGSYPLTFTQAAILLLAQEGKLRLDDPIIQFFPDAPADKRGITLQHLLDGAAGLPNFHGDAERDSDHDLSPLSRDEAVQRMFAVGLLFAPGSETAFSHSGYGLLAAVVEQASGVSYPDFIRTRLLQPAGMQRTGFYGETLGLAPDQFASGHSQQVADPNIPPNWGPTSWLIMGSGGMVSTVADLQRYHAWIHRGELLTGEWLERYEKGRIVAGGTDRGFHTVRGWDGADSEVIVAANPISGWRGGESLPRDVHALLQPAPDTP